MSYTAVISAAFQTLARRGWEGPGTVRPLPNFQIADIHVELKKNKHCNKVKLLTIFVMGEKLRFLSLFAGSAINYLTDTFQPYGSLTGLKGRAGTGCVVLFWRR
jgi:hypothetical protein